MKFRLFSPPDRAVFVTHDALRANAPFLSALSRNRPDGMEKAMIELVIAACLATGECKESRLTYDAHDVSLLTCMIAGQADVARWQQQHPAWQIKRWHCGIAREYSQSL